MYYVIYKGCNGGFQITDNMSLKKAKAYKQKLIDAHYSIVYIIQIIET